MTGNATGIGCSRPRSPCATGYGRRADMKGPRSFSRRARVSASPRARQRGTILIIALIVLVAMTLAGIATMRSVDTATITAGNIGLRQASVNAADQGIQARVTWGGKANTCASTLSTAAVSGQGNDQTRPTDSHTTAPATHYRVTAKAVGPRNSISIVQTMVRAFN